VVECGGLENRCTRERTEGSNPSLSATVRWRLVDLCQWLFEEFRISLSKQTLSRELRAMGFRKLSARPRHHAQRTEDIEAFKKNSPPGSKRLPGTMAWPCPG
jgi:hypothetical protein